VGTSGRGPPLQDAWFWHFEPPALGLFHAVMVTAERGGVTGTGETTEMPGSGVIQIAAGGGLPAARRGARRVPGGDQVAELAAGPVAGVSLGVVAGAADDGVELEGAGVGGTAGVRAGSAGVRGGGAVRGQRGIAPPGVRVPGRGGQQVPGALRVEQPEPGRLAGGAAALGGLPRDGEGEAPPGFRTGIPIGSLPERTEGSNAGGQES